MVKNNDGLRASCRPSVTAMLLFVGIVGTIVLPGVIQPTPAAAFVQECRPLSSLNIQGQILSAASAVLPFGGPWRVRLTLNTNRHVMICNTDFYCPGNIDKCAFRPPLSSNIDSVEVVSSTCQMVWDIEPVSYSVNIEFGFKLKYQEDVVGSGGSGINPMRKTTMLTIHPPSNYVYGTEFDIMDTLVAMDDDGN